MAGEILAKNLEVMKKFMYPTPYQCLVRSLESSRNDILDVEDNGTPFPSLLLHTATGKTRINSGREPEIEAERQIDIWLSNHPSASSSLIIMIGCAGMAHLHRMAAQLKSNGHIFVLEPHPEIFHNILKSCDLSPLLQHPPGTFHFSVDPDLNIVIAELKEQLRQNETGKFTAFALPALERLFRDEYQQIKEQIETLRIIEQQNRNTEAIYSRVWLNNAIQNLPLIAASPEIGLLRNKFAGTTAVVAAAGPGLNAMLPWIKSVSDKYLIIAVGTSLSSLIGAGIEPDFVLAVDSSTEIIPQFAGYTTRRTCLVGAQTLHPEIFAFFPGRSLFFTADIIPGYNYWLEKLGILPERLRVGGTVSLSAIDFAIHLGCRHLVLAGLDLAFAEDGATHASGTIYEKSRITSGAWLSIPGNHEKTVRSSRQFISYIKMIESYLIEQYRLFPGLKVYNANPGGAAIRGTDAVIPPKLQEIELPPVQNEKDEYIFNLIGVAGKKIPVAELMRQVDMMRQELRQVSEHTSVAVAVLDEYEQQGDKTAPPQLFALLDAVDVLMKKCDSAALLLESITKVLYADVNGINADINVLLRQNKEIYRCLNEQATHAADELERGSARMQRPKGEING